ncbi:DMT family transporter [Halosquirtibacter laminarini]|uniref:DMT family transporter n=1 Tax=Halosquirtibacter laminarini TaxID=3374600 RepID=A0AC61NFW9_9BACT|nr:DMT family transporter [Prolixibacteraceae bacterium]
MKNTRTIGYILCVLATISFCHIFIFSKKAMETSTLEQFCLYWFGFSFILNGFTMRLTNSRKNIKTIIIHNYKVLIVLGVLEIIISTMLFSAIHFIPNAAVSGMLGNLFPIFTAIFGVTLLKEKLYKKEYIGLVAAFVGILITSFPDNMVISDLLNKGTVLMVGHCLIAAFETILIKTKINKIPPLVLNTNRAIFLLIYAICSMFYTNTPWAISIETLKNIAIGAFIGPFLAINLVYYSLKYMDASRATVIQSSKGLVLILCTYLYWGEVPKLYQVLGGVTTLLGLVYMTWVEVRMKRLELKIK